MDWRAYARTVHLIDPSSAASPTILPTMCLLDGVVVPTIGDIAICASEQDAVVVNLTVPARCVRVTALDDRPDGKVSVWLCGCRILPADRPDVAAARPEDPVAVAFHVAEIHVGGSLVYADK